MKRASQFAAVRAGGVSRCGRYVVLCTLPFSDDRASEHSLFGLVATKRLGHAVTRNRLRRRVRELLRELGGALAVGYYVTVILKQSAVRSDYSALRRDLGSLIARCTP